MENNRLHTPHGDIPLTGCVKWYSFRRQYGFAGFEGVGSDVLLHAHVLQAHGRRWIAEGAQIVAYVERRERGIQVVQLLTITDPPAPPVSFPENVPHLSADELDALPLQPARVRWFDPKYGYGFANAFGSREDIFLHASVLHASGTGWIEAGDALGVRQVAGERGPFAIQVLPWFAAAAIPNTHKIS